MDDLHRLLGLARTRGQIALAERLTAELEARRNGPAARRPPPLPLPRARPAPRRGPATAVLAISALLGAGLAWGLSLPGFFTQTPHPVASRAMMLRASTAPVPAQPPPPAEAEPVQAPVAAEPVAVASADKPNPCLDLPTPGQRLLCGYPSLAIQDHQLTAIYERALKAAPDPLGLAREQAAWRRARDEVWDREQLNAMYQARIAELEAAAGAPAPPPS